MSTDVLNLWNRSVSSRLLSLLEFQSQILNRRSWSDEGNRARTGLVCLKVVRGFAYLVTGTICSFLANLCTFSSSVDDFSAFSPIENFLYEKEIIKY